LTGITRLGRVGDEFDFEAVGAGEVGGVVVLVSGPAPPRGE
jgi:hypothetical protein